MYRRLFTICFILLTFNGITQNTFWQNINDGAHDAVRTICTDTINDVMYVAGNLTIGNSANYHFVMKWDGIQWDTLPGFFDGVIFSSEFFQGELYIGGSFEKMDTVVVNAIAKWDGNTWNKIGEGLKLGTSRGTVWNFKIYKDELYIMGTFDSSGTNYTLNGLAKWTGSEWIDSLSLPMLEDPPSYNSINCMAYYKEEIYLGGNFSNDTLADIVRFDGTGWRMVGERLSGGLSAVVRMEVFQNELYIAGTFSRGAGNFGNYIQRWDGHQWKDVGGGTDGPNPGNNAQIQDMKIHNNELFVSGVFYKAGGVPAPKVAKWDGTQWCGFGGVFDANVGAIGFYRDTLIIGGGFISISGDTMNQIAKWTGGSYTDTCGVINSVDAISTNIMDEIILFPNPASEKINIKSDLFTQEITIEIASLLGEPLFVANYQKDKIQLNVSNYKPGIYLIKIRSGQKVVVKKVIINR